MDDNNNYEDINQPPIDPIEYEDDGETPEERVEFEEWYQKALESGEIEPYTMTPREIYDFLKEYGTKEQIEEFLKEFDGVPPVEVLAEIKKITNHALVVQSNELAEASQNLTAIELRIVYNLVGLLNPKDETDFISTKVYIRDVAKLCELDPKNAYRQIEKACDNIMKKPIIINTKDRNGKKITLRRTWFIQLDTFEGESYIQFKFHPDLRDELLQFHKYGRGYVSTKGNILNALGDVFSMRFFNLMLKNLKLKKCEYTIEQIIVMFQLEGKYIDKRTGKLNISLFIKRVIQSAVDKINNLTDLQVEYQPVKVGRKVESIRFFVKMKKNAAADVYADNYMDVPTPEESVSWMQLPAVSKMLATLKGMGFSEAYRSPALGKFTNADDFLAAAGKAVASVTAAQNNPNSKRIVNPGAMLFKIIMDYDTETERLFAQEEKEARAEKELKDKERKETVRDIETWENIVALAAEQSDKKEAVSILREGAKQHPDVLERYKKAYALTYPGYDTYDVEMEITRINLYGVSEIKKTPVVKYELLKDKNKE